MTIEDVWQNMLLTKKVFRDLIVTSNFDRVTPEIISWKNYGSGIFKSLYAKEYEVIIRNRQYSFLLAENKGCVQVYFHISGDNVEKVKMAYYPYPVGLNDSVDDHESFVYDADDELIGEYYFDLWNILSHQFELSLNDDELKELVRKSKQLGNDETPENLILGKFETKYKFTNSSHMRIDYDPRVQSHHKCEIQLGAINNIRLPMKKLIMPFVFFDFIAKNLYPDKYEVIKSKSNFPTDFSISKRGSFTIDPFVELNIFLDHN